ncbi:hypothetical protein FCV25MIE_34449 [Fagus crenata]
MGQIGAQMKDDPKKNGSQSGVDFCTMIQCITSSSLFSAYPSDNDNDDDLEVEEVGSRSISISWASLEDRRCGAQVEVSVVDNNGDLRGRLRFHLRLRERGREVLGFSVTKLGESLI